MYCFLYSESLREQQMLLLCFCRVLEHYFKLISVHFWSCILLNGMNQCSYNFFTTLQVFEENPLKKTYSASEESSEVVVKGQPNTALLSTIMVLGTFLVAFYLRKFRTSYFFGKKVCSSHIHWNYLVSSRWSCSESRHKEKAGGSEVAG